LDKIKIIWVYFNKLNEISANWDYLIQIWVKKKCFHKSEKLGKFQQTKSTLAKQQ